jgi:hypothetical protein
MNILDKYEDVFFFCKTQYRYRRWHMHTYTYPYKHTHAHPTLWAPLRDQVQETDLMDLDIDEVTTGVSLLTGTSSSTENVPSSNETQKC